jgi:heterodisulfide reductase subunit A2
MLPGWKPGDICPVALGGDGFIKSMKPKTGPSVTDLEGVFVAGVAAGPKDIVDTITEAGAAAMEAAKYLTSLEARATDAAKEEALHA